VSGIRRLQDWVHVQAQKRPEATAVVGGEEALPYGRLEDATNQLAHLLREAGCRRGDRVGLLLPKSPVAIVGLLGIYKADAIAVPLDPAGPAARVRRILTACESRYVLAGGAVVDLVGELLRTGPSTDLRLGWLGCREELHGRSLPVWFAGDDLARYPAAPPSARNRSEDPAHILFTSGSTGEPKGVVIPHANVIHFVEWATRHFGIGSGERLSGHSPLHFDLSTFDVFGAFAAGAELHLVAPELNLLPNRLAEFIRRSRLTQWFSVPSVLNYMAWFDVVRPHDFPSLRRLLWCGEVFPTPNLVHWMKRLPHVAFTNLYGPTETTIASSYYDVARCPEDERAPVPIGRACEGEELLVLGEDGSPAPPGVTGELHIAGRGLSPGYWGDPERTRAAFVPRPAPAAAGERMYRTGDLARTDERGLVYLLGRTDSQIKSRGYRIELGEIESALGAVRLVDEAVVAAIPTRGFGDYLICCAYAAPAGQPASPAEVRRELSRRLPGYMLPSRWLVCDRLPRNGNGKLDRKRIKEAFEREEALAAG
jgi:amino acid adenylation domain-containing protein